MRYIYNREGGGGGKLYETSFYLYEACIDFNFRHESCVSQQNV
jgi:hypothetical protein